MRHIDCCTVCESTVAQYVSQLIARHDLYKTTAQIG